MMKKIATLKSQGRLSVVDCMSAPRGRRGHRFAGPNRWHGCKVIERNAPPSVDAIGDGDGEAPPAFGQAHPTRAGAEPVKPAQAVGGDLADRDSRNRAG